jgi:hypothetical protein
MFIKKLSAVEINQINNERPPLYREQNVVWASEGSVDLTSDIHTGDCQRSLFYKFLGIPESNKMPVKVKNICDAGLMYESEIINNFKKSGLFIDEQIRLEFIYPDTINEVISSGKMDLLIQDDDKFKGIEIKTISGFKVDKVFGTDKDFPLPASKNLIQAMNYKYRTMQGPVLCNDGIERQIDDVYLLYIDRGSFTRMYFKVDLDAQGYAVVTPIDQFGNEFETIKFQNVDSFETLLTHSTTATTEQSRLAELRFSIYDLGKKYDSVYNYVREKTLPPKDYSIIYNADEIEREYHLGRLSKIKYNKFCKSQESTGDMLCTFCNYRDKCMQDDHINIIE